MKHYMQAAYNEALLAAKSDEVPVGCIIVCNGMIIAKTHNLCVSEHDATAHAEMIAIREACRELGRWRLSGLTLYVTIEPCPMCAGALVMSRVVRVVYGSTDAKAGAAESVFNIVEHPTLNHQLQVTAGVLQEECAGIMKRFFRERRAKKKSRPIDVS